MEGLRSLLETTEGLRVVAAENSLEDAMDAARQLRPTVMVVDKALGISAVMDWLRVLRTAKSPMAVVVWGVLLPEAEAVRFLQAGAAGVVRKTAPLSDLLTCIRIVASGGAWMEADLETGAGRPAGSGRSPLTARELQVIKLIEQGRRNKDIAMALGISTGTVKVHVNTSSRRRGFAAGMDWRFRG